jgi:hypothetical protein
VASAAWLAGLGAAPTVAGLTLTLLPVGFALLPVLALAASGRWAADASAVARRGEAVAVAVSAALAFAAVTAIVAAMSDAVAVPVLRAAVLGGVLAFAITTWAVMRRARILPKPSSDVRNVAAAAATAILALVAVSGLLLVLAIVTHVDAVTALLVELDAGPAGILLLVALSLGYLPTALAWSTAYLLGPGISLGVGSTLSPFADVASTSMPGFPLLAALPSQAPPGSVLLPAFGIAAGALAGGLLRRRGAVGPRGALLAGLSAALVGIALSGTAWLASGSLGDTSLIGLGPSPVLMGLAGAGLTAIGGVAVAAWPARGGDE